MKKIIFAIILIISIILIGTVGYMIIEKWDIFDSFYQTIITISTVGFQEVSQLGLKGRILTIVLIILGIGIGGYTIGNLSAFLIEGHIRNLLRGKKMEKEITSLKNHVIVCGFGRTGVNISEVLKNRKKNFIIVEKDEDRVLEAQNKNFLVVHGDATDDEILSKSGVKVAYSLITTLGNDADNLYVALTARGMNHDLRIIARAVDDNSAKKLVRAGADKIVAPFSIAGRRMAYLATNPEIVEFLEVMTQSTEIELKIEQVIICKKSHLVNKQLNQSNIKSETRGAMIIGIKKEADGKMIVNPSGETLLEEGDILIVLGNDSQVEHLQKIAESE